MADEVLNNGSAGVGIPDDITFTNTGAYSETFVVDDWNPSYTESGSTERTDGLGVPTDWRSVKGFPTATVTVQLEDENQDRPRRHMSATYDGYTWKALTVSAPRRKSDYWTCEISLRATTIDATDEPA